MLVFKGVTPTESCQKNVAEQVAAPALLSASFSADVTLKRFSTRSGRSTWTVLWQALGPVEGTDPDAQVLRGRNPKHEEVGQTKTHPFQKNNGWKSHPKKNAGFSKASSSAAL